MRCHLNTPLKKQGSSALFLLFAWTILFPAYLPASSLQTVSVERDSVPVHTPCYDAFEKAVIKSAFITASTAGSIKTGVIDYIGRVAFLNRQFYICMKKQYPHGKK